MFGKYDDFIDIIYCYKYESQSVKYIDDVIKEMEWWSCFEQSDENKEQNFIESDEDKNKIAYLIEASE